MESQVPNNTTEHSTYYRFMSSRTIFEPTYPILNPVPQDNLRLPSALPVMFCRFSMYVGRYVQSAVMLLGTCDSIGLQRLSSLQRARALSTGPQSQRAQTQTILDPRIESA